MTHGVKHFKNETNYRKWLAYGHIHGDFKVAGNQKVYVAGTLKKVKHQ